MRSLSIAAASSNLPNSLALLITRLCGRLSYALAVLNVRDECIVKRSAKIVNRKLSLSGLVGGRGESAEARGAFEGASADSGVSMELADVIELDPRRASGAVFVGTSVPITLLFEFLQDDQTLETFLDQFPTVSRDQARAVLGASRDMLLSAAGSET